MDARWPFEILLAPELVTLDRPLATRTQFVVAWSFVDDRRVRERDSGNVRRFDHDVDIALGRKDRPPHVFGPEFIGWDE